MDAGDFDDLVLAVTEAMQTIREAHPEDPEPWLDRFFERDESGELVPRRYTFRVPPPPGSREPETVELSLLEVLAPVQVALERISVELDCVLGEAAPAKGDAAGRPRLTMSLREWHRERREGIDKIRITVQAGDPVQATAYVNGKPFKSVP